jgi:hypothetical protein
MNLVEAENIHEEFQPYNLHEMKQVAAIFITQLQSPNPSVIAVQH